MKIACPSAKSRDFRRLLLAYKQNGIPIPTFMPYEPVLLGMGVVFNIVILVPDSYLEVPTHVFSDCEMRRNQN